jgi:CO/xanthine dehydrogenase FAD-binding subunit
MAQIKHYIKARSIQEACSCLEQPDARAIAGGTDILLKAGKNGSGEITLVDISDIEELSGVYKTENGIRIGATTKLAEIVQDEKLREVPYSVLVQGAVQVGSPQIRNLATLGGNLCNAAPSADTAAPMLVLDACAEIVSSAGTRSMPLSDFFKGPGKTALQPGELLSSVVIPYTSPTAKAVYLKHCPRKAMDLAVVGIAVFRDQKTVRIAMGAVAPIPQRAYAAETFLQNSRSINAAVLEEAAKQAAEASSPISDVRSSQAYRKQIVAVLTKRALHQVFEI